MVSAAEFSELVTIAGRAPSVHNTQPWQFRLADPHHIELEIAAFRSLPHGDPRGRELVISCGAALHNLLVGLRVHGLRGEVCAVPDPARPLVVATVTVEPAEDASEAERRALLSVFRRHTHRQGFEAPIDDARLITRLTRLAEAENVDLAWITDPHQRRELIAITRIAAGRERSTPALASETGSWSALRASQHDGVPAWALAPRQVGAESIDRLPDRFISVDRIRETPPGPGTLAVLLTDGDGVGDWLSAGRALQRVLLRAAQEWAFAAFATPALEDPELRDAVREMLDTASYPQMILEVGYSHLTYTTGRLDPTELIAPAER